MLELLELSLELAWQVLVRLTVLLRELVLLALLKLLHPVQGLELAPPAWPAELPEPLPCLWISPQELLRVQVPHRYWAPGS